MLASPTGSLFVSQSLRFAYQLEARQGKNRMWIDRLDLLAFGHFTDVRLTLGPGLHLVYGPNEAGKSTTLRAIRQFLFGFDERTTDNFVHQNPNLRIGGVLRDESGRSLEVVRRKTRKDSLLAADQETPIDPKVWDEWLCHIDESTFSNRYGIDYDQLTNGGHEIATGTGDLGEILFAAGSGILDLTAVQKYLAEEAADIFRPQGKKQRLNQAIVEWQSQRDLVTKSLLPVAEWEEADRSRQDCVTRLQAVTEQVQLLESKLDLLRRKEKSRPFLAELKKLEAEMSSFEVTPSLPPGFSNKKQDAILQWKQSTTIETDERELLRKLDDEIGQIVVPGEILACATEIGDLLTEWGSFRKAQTDRPGLADQLQRLREQSQLLLSQLQTSSEQPLVAELQINREERHKIAQLVQRHAQLTAAIVQSEKQSGELATQLEEASKRAGSLRNEANVDELRNVVKEVRAAGDLGSRYHQLSQEIEQSKLRMAEQCEQLGIKIEASSKLRAIRVPTDAALRQQDVRLDEIRSEKAVLQSRLSELESEFNGLKQQIDELRDQFQVPSEDDLRQIRAERNELVKQFRQTLEENKKPSTATWAKIETAIERADSISDRLRHEADRVAKLVELSADLNSNETRQHEISVRLSALDARQIEAEKQWATDWPDLKSAPQSIRELQNWLAKRDIVIQLMDDLNRRETLAFELQTKMAASRESLISVLEDRDSSDSRAIEPVAVSDRSDAATPLRKQLSFGWEEDEPRPTTAGDRGSTSPASEFVGRSLEELLQLAEEKLEKNEEIQNQRRDVAHLIESIERQQANGRSQQERFQREYAEWTTEWQRRLGELKLPLDSTPDVVTNLVESSIESTNLRRQIEQLAQRIEGIDQDGVAFRSRARSLFERAAADLVDAELETAVKAIQTRLIAAQRDQTKLNELNNRKDLSQRKLSAARAVKVQAVDLIHELLRETGGPDSLTSEPTTDQFDGWIVTLNRFEEQAKQKAVLEDQARRLVERLTEFAKEEPLESFLAAIQVADPGELESRIRSLKEDCDRLEIERDQLNRQIGSAEERLLKMNGVSQAAEAEEQQTHIFARIRSDVEQYARAKLASVILHAAIERYRDRIRGPVLKVASELFRELTLGSFQGLRVDEDDHGKPVLVGIRHEQNARVSVDGMSEGTCDQLYLALRMASLQLEVPPRSHLPFIIDDILIQFDDARSAAALKVLARFSQQRQMIFFTHHERLVEIARRELGAEVKTHQLSS